MRFMFWVAVFLYVAMALFCLYMMIRAKRNGQGLVLGIVMLVLIGMVDSALFTHSIRPFSFSGSISVPVLLIFHLSKRKKASHKDPG